MENKKTMFNLREGDRVICIEKDDYFNKKLTVKKGDILTFKRYNMLVNDIFYTIELGHEGTDSNPLNVKCFKLYIEPENDPSIKKLEEMFNKYGI